MSQNWLENFRFEADPEVRQNWADLLSLLPTPEDVRNSNQGIVDQMVVGVARKWLEKNDQCGVMQDLLDVALQNFAGTTLEELGDDEEDQPGYNQTETFTATGRSSTEIEVHGGGRYLEFFTEEKCTTYESTIFLGSMLSFSSCAEIDIGRFFGTVEENLVNVGLKCLNTFLQPFKRTQTCASRNFQNYVMDECVKGVVKDDILGHIFQLFLINPKKTCGCMASLANVPVCRVDVSREISLDGLFASKMACFMESNVCSTLEEECDNRLTVLDQCLPDMFDIDNDNFDCEEVLCNCEKNDKGLLNYAGRAMELPMSDMCVDQAALNYVGEFIPERYATFQEKCGAKFLHMGDPPSLAPTMSMAPSASPSEDESVSSLIGQTEDSPVNSVVSGILLALAITGIASIFLVFFLVLWRRRFREKGKQVQTIAEMKAHAQEQIRRLESDLRRMEELEQYEEDNRANV